MLMYRDTKGGERGPRRVRQHFVGIRVSAPRADDAEGTRNRGRRSVK